MSSENSLAAAHVQICYLEETHLETITTLLALVYAGKGCEIYRTNIFVPYKTDFTHKTDASIRCIFFVGFSPTYKKE